MTESDSAPKPVSKLFPLLMFVVWTLFSLAGMSIVPGIYDEGITLTGAMRVAAGQLPHRDFYAIYGPAHFYVLAWLFDLFGQSLLVERVLYGVISGLVVAAVYVVLGQWCSRWVALLTALATMLWLFALNSVSGAAMYPASLCNMAGVVLVLPVFVQKLSVRRSLAIGLVAAAGALFRYDTGIGLLGVQSCVIGVALLLQVEKFDGRGVWGWLRSLFASLWPCYAGFALVLVPLAIAYLAVAPLHAFLHDIVLFPHQYYYRARNLPFPRLHRGTLDNLAVYLPLIAVMVALYVGVVGSVRGRGAVESLAVEERKRRAWLGFLVAFGLLSLIMYLKGLVRASAPHMYLSIQPALLLVAVLWQYRSAVRPVQRWLVQGLVVLSVLVTFLVVRDQVRFCRRQHTFIESELVHGEGRMSPLQRTWCATPSPLTKGFCFLPDDDRIRTVEFLDSHTTSAQRIFVGVTHHDKIFVNDNLIYFAAHRLPATHWSHFDPLLQTRADTQRMMIAELQAEPPPYVVEDAEFDFMNEPNESAISTGVTLLDDYIHSHYSVVETYGVFTIWERRPGV